MVALRFTLDPNQMTRRMRDRFLAGAPAGSKIVWQNSIGQRVLIFTDSLATKFLDSWLIVNLDLQTDQTGRQTLQFVYFLGKAGEGDSVQAAATINAPSVQAAQLADAWGKEVQRVLWDAVLDAIEFSVHKVGTDKPGEKLTLAGFFSSADGIHVDVLAGEA